MDYSRRDFGRLALAGLPAAALLGRSESLFGAALVQAKPNSLVNGVQIGTITYSYGSMPDQSAEATLRYVLESGISAIELMGAPVDSYARAQTGFTGGRAGGGGRGGGAPGGPGGAAAAGAGAGRRGGGAPPAPAAPDPSDTRSWNGQPCPAGRGGPGGGGGRGAGGPGAAGPAAAGATLTAAMAAPGGAGAPAQAGAPGGRGGRGPQTPEQIAAADELRKWQLGLSMDIFKRLRKMYNDAGVTIYAVKNLGVDASDEELEFQFNVAEALEVTHVTAELPVASATSTATLKRVGDYALKRKIYAAYHTHTQGSITVFDEAFAASKGNMANVDFGHYVAAGGDPIPFLNKFHDRIASFHLKDRTRPQHCELNLAWGQGETPIKEILQLVKKNKWKMPATIELEYRIPEGSDAPREVRKCLDYCRAALA